MEEAKEETKVAKNTVLWAYFACGTFIVAMLLRYVWQIDGMSEQFEWERWRLIAVAAAFGFGLGWLYFPRPLRFLSDD